MKEGITFTGRQIAAARTLIGLDQRELAQASGISAPTLRRMELTDGIPSGIRNNLLAIERALEEAGVEFTPAGKDGGAGVRLRIIEAAVDATNTGVKPPKGGMQGRERAHKREAVRKLKNKRAKLKK